MADANRFRAGREGPHERIQDRLHRRRHDHGRVPSRRLQGGGLSGRGDRLAHQGHAEKVAERWGIPTVHDTPEALIKDTNVEILDLAFPPDQQPALIRHALKQKHIKAILAQKPLALSLR